MEIQTYNPPKKKDHLEVIISPHKVSSTDPFLGQKTSNRSIYKAELERSKNQKIYDILFANEKGNITEGAFNNIFIQGNRGELFTPSFNCGLLPGILRAKLVDSGKFKETSLTCDELEKATKIWLGNSVTGLVEVKLGKSSKTR